MSENIRINARALGLIGLLGGLGGAINAWLCYAKLPVPVGGVKDPTSFSWEIIPLGLVHGSLLALISAGLPIWLWNRRRFLRWIGLPIAGWIAGWITYIPIGLYIARHMGSSSLSAKDAFELLVWPIAIASSEDFWTGIWIAFAFPYFSFGFVGLVFYLLLNVCRRLLAKKLPWYVLIASVSGCLGSLMWWISYKPWYLSLIHGTIWGSLVGFGVWKSQQMAQRS